MKHPVLKIKKGAEFNDDARPEANRPVQHPPAAPPAPLKRRNRIVLFPLVFLALVVLLVLRFMPHGPTDRATIAGWEVVLRATPHDQTLIIGVTFIEAGKGTEHGATPADALIHVVAPDTGAELSLSGALWKSPMTIRGEMPYTTKLKRLHADVTIGGSHVRLTLNSRAAR